MRELPKERNSKNGTQRREDAGAFSWEGGRPRPPAVRLDRFLGRFFSFPLLRIGTTRILEYPNSRMDPVTFARFSGGRDARPPIKTSIPLRNTDRGEQTMRRLIALAFLLLLALLSSACYYNPMPLLGRAVYYPKYEVTQDTDSMLTVHVSKKMDIQFRKLPDRDCWISTTEVSIAQMKASWRWWRPDLSWYKKQPGYLETWPAMNVMLDEASYYCSWLNRRMKHEVIPEEYSVRLPTVEEWESAAKCGTDRVYPWGNEWPPAKFADGRYPNLMGEDRYLSPSNNIYVGNDYCGIPFPERAYIPGYRDGFPGPCPVELAGKNEWGLVGLAGNVEEWCWDEKKQDYVLKGGCWKSAHPDSPRIFKSHEMPVSPWPFCPLLRDRRSHYGGGFRVVIAPEMK